MENTVLFISGKKYIYLMKMGEDHYAIDIKKRKNCIYCIESNYAINYNEELMTYIKNMIKLKFSNDELDEFDKILYFNHLISGISLSHSKL